MPSSALVVKSKQDSTDPKCQPELRVENEPQNSLKQPAHLPSHFLAPSPPEALLPWTSARPPL